MDILSHGLWAAAAAKGANLKRPRALSAWKSFGWGVFPDLFAFAIPTVWMWSNRLTRGTPLPDWESMRETGMAMTPSLQLASKLYNLSHSLIVFTLVVGAWTLIRHERTKEKEWTRNVPWEMSGWLLHILADIPTHTRAFFPTPVFWPLSSWNFNGFSWGQPWFLAFNYGSLALVFTYIFIRSRRIKKGPIEAEPFRD